MSDRTHNQRIGTRFLPLMFLAICAAASACASPITGLPSCASLYDFNCVSATPGGDTTITQSFFAGSYTLEVYGVLNGGQTIFAQVYGLPGTSSDPAVQALVTQADAAIARFAPYDPLPSCGNTSSPYCYGTNPGGALVVTNSTTSAYVNVDTPVSQRVDQFQTTVDATLNGNQTVFQESFAAGFSDPAVQAAIEQADSILAADKASFGAPVLASGSTSLQSSQTTYVQSGPPVADGTSAVTTVTTFGPALIDVGQDQTDPFFVLSGQSDINVNTYIEYDVPRNAITTDTYLTAQTYDINGTSFGAPVPEPATWAMLGVGLWSIFLLNRKRA